MAPDFEYDEGLPAEPEPDTSPAEEMSARDQMDMALPPNEPQRDDEGSSEMFERVKKWDDDFKESARRALRDVYGYKTAEVLDFRSLNGKEGHDENDYELTVQVGDASDDIGGEGLSTVKIIVRRTADESLLGG